MADIKQIKVDSTTYDIKDSRVDTMIPSSSDIGSVSQGVYLNNGELKACNAVVDNVSSTAADAPLSANQGKLLNDRIKNIEARGRFLSTWNATTGKPSDLPSTIATEAYTYKTGDYYIVNVAGNKNPSVPSGNTIPAGTTLEDWTYFVTGTSVSANDTIYFTGSAWSILQSPVTTTVWGAIGGILPDQTDLQTALNEKQDKSTLENDVSAKGFTKNTGTVTSVIVKMNGSNKGTITSSGTIDLGTVVTDVGGKADKTSTVSTVTYDATNKKITKTINSSTTDVVSVSTLKTDMALSKSDVGLSNVGNFKAVSTVASQGLTDTEKLNARTNIGAGTVSSLSDLSVTATASELNVLDGVTATTAELNYTDGVTSNIQTQLNSKGTYSKPSGGIPKTDLASAVQTSLGKADTALQSHQSLSAYRTASAQDTIDSGKQATLTSAQINACNSGITSSKVSTYDGYNTTISGKEAKGKMTISGTEYSVSKHTITIVTNGVTSTFNVLGV